MSQLREMAMLANQYQQAYQAGQLSAADFKELINDLNIAQNIENSASELEEDVMYRQVLIGAFQLASAIY